MTIVEFLEARIAEDEALARAVIDGPDWTVDEESFIVLSGAGTICYDVSSDEVSQHIARHDPARILTECAAKRAIVKLCTHYLYGEIGRPKIPDSEWMRWGDPILFQLAAIYASHPDYRREWTP